MGPESLEAKQQAAIEEILKVYPQKAAKNRENTLVWGLPMTKTKKPAGMSAPTKKPSRGL